MLGDDSPLVSTLPLKPKDTMLYIVSMLVSVVYKTAGEVDESVAGGIVRSMSLHNGVHWHPWKTVHAQISNNYYGGSMEHTVVEPYSHVGLN